MDHLFCSGEYVFKVFCVGRVDKYKWEFEVHHIDTQELIAKGDELWTPTNDPQKAVQSLIGFLTCDDRSLFVENGWTHDPDEFQMNLEIDWNASQTETVYTIHSVPVED